MNKNKKYLEELLRKEIVQSMNNGNIDEFAHSLFCECIKWRSRFKFVSSFLPHDISPDEYQVGRQFDKWKKIELPKELEIAMTSCVDPTPHKETN